MKRLLLTLALLLFAANLNAQSTGTPSQIRVLIDANGYLVTSNAAQTPPYTTVVFSNARLTVDSQGRLLTAGSGGGGGGTIATTTLVLKGDNAGNAIAATSGTDYVIPAGNVATATALQNARTIQGVSFNGTANIAIFDQNLNIADSPTFFGLTANTFNVAGDMVGAGGSITSDMTWAANIIDIAYGGTGASLADPNADRILFWDDSVGAFTFLTVGSGLDITDTTLTATGSGAPTDATYITQTSNAGLSAEQALDSLTTGIVKVTNGTGVLSTASAGTDYIATLVPLSLGTNLVEQLNSTNAQEFRIYNTDNGANDEYARLIWSANTFDIGTVKTGSGTARSFRLWYGDTTTPAITIPITSGGVTIDGIVLSNTNVQLSTGTGTKFGTATTQKLAFFNSTPIVQPANTVQIDTLLVNLGLRASGGVANFTTAIKGEGGYQSSDGSAGVTVTTCTSFKNGLCVAGT